MDTVFDQALANQVTKLINDYVQHGDLEAHDALLSYLETHSTDDALAITISAALEYDLVYTNQA